MRAPTRGLFRVIRAAISVSASDLRLRDPVRWGAICAYLFASLLILAWWLTYQALEGTFRPWPTELADLASRHDSDFIWTGVVWFCAHLLALPFIAAIFLTHANEQRPALWFFTITMTLAAVLWMAFGVLSVPLGANVGPHFGQAVTAAHLDAKQHQMWLTRCKPGNGAPFGIPDAWLAANCESQDEPLLLAAEPETSGLTEAQLLPLQRAWAVAQDGWIVRKLSDATYFGANALAMLSFVFFAIYMSSSRRIQSVAITLGLLVTVCWAVGLLAFEYPDMQYLVVVGIGCQILWLFSVGTDLWSASVPRVFGRDLPRPPARVGVTRGVAALRDGGIDAIKAMHDPVARNKRITLAYHDIALELDSFVHALAAEGETRNANWCHFAAWASRSVGERLIASDGEPEDEYTVEGVLDALSARLAEGNLAVFAHIAPALVSLLSTISAGPSRNGPRDPLDTPEIDEELREPLNYYVRAAESMDATQRAQLIYMGNLKLVQLEQLRLEGKILEATTAPLASALFYPASLFKLAIWVVCAPPLLVLAWLSPPRKRGQQALGRRSAEILAQQNDDILDPRGIGPVAVVKSKTRRLERWLNARLHEALGQGIGKMLDAALWPTPYRGWRGRVIAGQIQLRVGPECFRLADTLTRPQQEWLRARDADGNMRQVYLDGSLAPLTYFPAALVLLAGEDRDFVRSVIPSRSHTIGDVTYDVPERWCFRVDRYDDLSNRMRFIAVFFRSRQQLSYVRTPPYTPREMRTARITIRSPQAVV
jgi:hypothetical protein